MSIVTTVDAGVSATIKVYQTTNKLEADLWVYKTDARSLATGSETIWFFTDNRAAATQKVFFTDGRLSADLIVYFVDSRSIAGWKKAHKLQGQLK